MMSVSRPRPVSRSILLASFLAVFLGFAWVTPSVAQIAVGFVPTHEATSQQRTWLSEDAGWLRSVPPAARALGSADFDSLTTVSADSMQTYLDDLRRRVAAAAVADGDTLPPVRSIGSQLRDRWVDRGHLQARVTLRADTLWVDPGAVWTVGQLVVDGPEFAGREHLLGTWLPREGDTFRRSDFDQGVTMVLKGAGEAGYPFARWVARDLSLDEATRTVRVEARLLPGNAAFIGPVTSDLPEGRAANFLARAAGIRTGDLFQQSELDRAVQRLQARDLYTSVGIPSVYLTSAADTVGVHFPVVPRRKANNLQVILGLSRAEDGSTRLSGQVDLNLPNMAGSGRALRVGWRDDGVRTSRFGFSYLEPLIFGTPLDMGLALDNEIDSEAYTRFRLDNVWRLPVVALWGMEVGIGWDRVTYPIGSIERTNRVRGRGAIAHHRGDRTRSGWEGLFAIETARRSATPRTDPDAEFGTTSELAEVVTQRIFEVDSAGELMLSGTVALAGRASFRQLTGGDPVVPLSEQFLFGGAATVRGYRENEFHGSQAAWAGVELRIGRPLGSRLYTFYDVGYFEFKFPDPLDPTGQELLVSQGWPKGYGLGLLARTRAGDISLAIGFPGTVDFDQAKLHVTLLESF